MSESISLFIKGTPAAFGRHLEAVTRGRGAWFFTVLILVSGKDSTTFVLASCIATKLTDCLLARGNCVALDA